MRERMEAARAALSRGIGVIFAVENRCMAADGPVIPTLQEMREDELREVYLAMDEARKLLSGEDRCVPGIHSFNTEN